MNLEHRYIYCKLHPGVKFLRSTASNLGYFVISFLFKWAILGLFLFIFVLPPLHNSINSWKHRWCASDSNPGRQNGRRRRIHLVRNLIYIIICHWIIKKERKSQIEGKVGHKRWLVILANIYFTNKYFRKENFLFEWAEALINGLLKVRLKAISSERERFHVFIRWNAFSFIHTPLIHWELSWVMMVRSSHRP